MRRSTYRYENNKNTHNPFSLLPMLYKATFSTRPWQKREKAGMRAGRSIVFHQTHSFWFDKRH